MEVVLESFFAADVEHLDNVIPEVISVSLDSVCLLHAGLCSLGGLGMEVCVGTIVCVESDGDFLS